MSRPSENQLLKSDLKSHPLKVEDPSFVVGLLVESGSIEFGRTKSPMTSNCFFIVDLQTKGYTIVSLINSILL
jgi:hypothetical protein